jgi:hypothetical protein
MDTSRFKMSWAIACIMLLLGFIGVILTNVKKEGAWTYWQYIVFVFALLSLAYNLASKREKYRSAFYTFWHELLHWVGLILCFLLLSFMVKIGIISRFTASLEILMLLALTTYLVGVYFDKIFIGIGIVLGLFAASIALFEQYLYIIIIPLVIIAIGVLVWLSRPKKNNKQINDQ